MIPRAYGLAEYGLRSARHMVSIAEKGTKEAYQVVDYNVSEICHFHAFCGMTSRDLGSRPFFYP